MPLMTAYIRLLVAQGVIQAFQNEHADSFSDEQSVGVAVKGLICCPRLTAPRA